MKKIAFYINSLGYGGAERVMCNLATYLSENNFQVLLITSLPVEKEYVCGEKVRRIYLNNHRIEHFIRRNLLLVKQLRTVLKEEEPDVLISFMAEPNYRAILASIGLKNKVIISVRNDPNKEYSGTLSRFLARKLFCLADGVVFQTEDAKRWFPAEIQNKSEIIFNQVDEIFYNTKVDGERHDVITLGRLVPQKNHKMLIRAFSSVAEYVPDNLIIYGEGVLRSELEHLISELHMEARIFLPGSISNVAETIVSAKLFVLSSDYEGMPNSLMEAMALGIPCISTDCPCGGPKMLFGKLMEDRLVICRDERSMADHLVKMLISNVDGKEEKLLAEQFHPKIIFARWVDYINRVYEQR